MDYSPQDIRRLLDRQEAAARRHQRAEADPAELDAEIDEATARLSVEERRIIGRFLQALLASPGHLHT